ncbi:MAG: hypothetical protein SF097_21165 [Acidobacteriota bacterium]|nr:hypothetical protein [Acidobacteriota bacterium]
MELLVKGQNNQGDKVGFKFWGVGAWLDLLPDGRFDASPEGMRYLGYTGREELTYYPAESLVKEFYSPEAVAEVLAKYTG